MNKAELLKFFLLARSKTYTTGKGKVEPLLPGSVQYEYKNDDWLYRDIYNIGNGIFAGLETVYYKFKTVLTVSYFGDFSKITEDEADTILRGALLANTQTARLWHEVNWSNGVYKYICKPSFPGNVDKFSGSEVIYKKNDKVYNFFYAGGFIGENV